MDIPLIVGISVAGVVAVIIISLTLAIFCKLNLEGKVDPTIVEVAAPPKTAISKTSDRESDSPLSNSISTNGKPFGNHLVPSTSGMNIIFIILKEYLAHNI